MPTINAAISRARIETDYGFGGGGNHEVETWAAALLDAVERSMATDHCARFVNDCSRMSEQDALLISFGIPVAVPVGLDVYDPGAASEETAEAALVEIDAA